MEPSSVGEFYHKRGDEARQDQRGSIVAGTERKKLGGFDKVLIGCGLGCAAVILLVFLSFAFGTMWLFTPGRQSATDVIADEESLGAIRLHALAQDPGTQELITRVLERVQETNREQQREQLPPSLRWLSDMQSQQADPTGLNMLFPKDMTFAFEAAENGEGLDWVAAFNPRLMVRLFKAMFGFIGRQEDSGQMRSTYQGHPIYRLEDEFFLAFASSTVLISNARRAVERALERIEAGDPALPRSSPGFDFTAVPEGDWDVEGALGHEAGLAASFLETVTRLDADEDATAELPAAEDLQVGFGFDVVSADEAVGRTVLECGDRQTAAQWRDVLERRYQAMQTEARARGLDYEIETRVEGRQVVTEMRLRGIEDLLVGALTHAEDDAEDIARSE